ncbi:MAG: glycosyltransferase family 2 protein [Bacillota bacterium]|nr:glycosyltransferase family 2 protein [Bacillota bacterium]
MNTMDSKSKKILVIIPAYNEEKSISKVIKSLFDSGHKVDLVVVDDGSKDKTSIIAKESGAKVLKLPFNLGIGGAMQTGYLYAKKNNYDVAIQLDGDGQHDPLYLGDLITPLLDGRSDMIIGSRYVAKTEYQSNVSRRIGMIFFSTLVTLLTGNPIKDTTSGFRAVNRKIIDYFADNYPSDYPEVDVLIRLHKKKFKVMEVPVEMKERQGGTSSITPLKSIYYVIKVSIVLLINSIRTGALS